MNNFIFSLNATLPVFIIIVLGYILMQAGIFNKEFTSVADKYVFKVALPVLLFKDIATTNIRQCFDLKFVLFCSLATISMFLIIWLFATIFIKDKTIVGAFTQASARGSAAVLGIAFVNNIYGDSGLAPLMIVAAVPFFNILSVIILTFCSNENTGNGNIKKAFVNVLKNPIILGILAGLIYSLSGLPIPEFALKSVTYIANTATPVALLVVGAGFEGKKAIAKLKPTIIATLLKLVIVPLVYFPIAVSLGFRNRELVAILVMLGAPTTVTCYIMAKNMGNDDVFSSSVVVLSTLLSSVTLTLWIFVLKSLNLI